MPARPGWCGGGGALKMGPKYMRFGVQVCEGKGCIFPFSPLKGIFCSKEGCEPCYSFNMSEKKPKDDGVRLFFWGGLLLLVNVTS